MTDKTTIQEFRKSFRDEETMPKNKRQYIDKLYHFWRMGTIDGKFKIREAIRDAIK